MLEANRRATIAKVPLPFPGYTDPKGPTSERFGYGYLDRQLLPACALPDKEVIAMLHKQYGHLSGAPRAWRPAPPPSFGSQMELMPSNPKEILDKLLSAKPEALVDMITIIKRSREVAASQGAEACIKGNNSLNLQLRHVASPSRLSISGGSVNLQACEYRYIYVLMQSKSLLPSNKIYDVPIIYFLMYNINILVYACSPTSCQR